jgi:hypothetical protein
LEIPTDLSRLWQLAGGDSGDSIGDWIGTFEPVGLILAAPPKNGGYWCTPRNSVAFAWTGGDGVHYSLVNVPDMPIDTAPIVMTVPMSDYPNIIVGANLREFLGLGCRFGYFALEQLAYDFDSTVDLLLAGDFDPEATAADRSLLMRLSDAFGLKPWDDPGERLETLADQYERLLDVPSSPDA